MSLVSYTFMETVCVYGYSLAIYIPAVVRFDSSSAIKYFLFHHKAFNDFILSILVILILYFTIH